MSIFNKSSISIAIGLCSLTVASSVLAVPPPPPPSFSYAPTGFYVGGFGGWGAFNKSNVVQSGIAIFPPGSDLGFPLPVDASGSIKSNSVGFGGLHIGYEWVTPHYHPVYKDDVGPSWWFVPGVELEGFYYSDTHKGNLFNPNPRLPDHLFADKFPTKTGVILVNWILSFDYPQMSTFIHPYVGVGLGAAINSISGAYSLQTNPPEVGVNHFNSDTSSTDWAFAAQAKAGIRFDVTEYCRLFAEYRIFYIGNTDYTFGATRYPTHVETSSWVVNLNNRYANAGSIGVDFTL